MWKVTSRNINMFLLIIMDKLFVRLFSYRFNKAWYQVSLPVLSVFFCWRFNVNVLQERLIDSQLLSKKRQWNVVFIFVVIFLFVCHRKASGFETLYKCPWCCLRPCLGYPVVASSKVISLQSSETQSALSILLKSDRSRCFLYRASKTRRVPLIKWLLMGCCVCWKKLQGYVRELTVAIWWGIIQKHQCGVVFASSLDSHL